MIEHVCDRAAQARLVDAVLVATDDDRIAQTVDAFGGTAVMTRATHETGTDRLAEVAAVLTGARIVVNVQGDEPLIAPEAIDDAVRPLVGHEEDAVCTLRARIETADELTDPSVVKIVIDDQGYALYFSRAAVPFVRPAAPAPTAWRHIGLYAYRREFLLEFAAWPPTPLERAEGLEQLRVLEHGGRIRTVETAVHSVGVDTAEDLERVRRLVEAGT